MLTVVDIYISHFLSMETQDTNPIIGQLDEATIVSSTGTACEF